MKTRNLSGALCALGLALALLLMLALLPVPARAVEDYDLWIGHTPVTSECLSGVDDNGGSWTFTPATQTTPNILTLNNYTYVGAGHENAALYYGSTLDLTIRLTGVNRLTHSAGTETPDNSYGMYIYPNIPTIITIESAGDTKGMLMATGGPANRESAGVCAKIDDDEELFLVQNANLSATGGAAEYSYGVNCIGNFEVRDGAMLSALSGDASATTCALNCVGGLTVMDNGKITAFGNTRSEQIAGKSAGIVCNSLTIATTSPSQDGIRSTVVAAGGGKGAESIGVDCRTCITVHGDSLLIGTTGGDADSVRYGLKCAEADLEGNVSVIGTFSDIGSDADGICAIWIDDEDNTVFADSLGVFLESGSNRNEPAAAYFEKRDSVSGLPFVQFDARKLCAVTLDANGGAFPDGEETKTLTVSCDITAGEAAADARPVLAGYTLDGWALTADGEPVGDSFIISEDVTLYALWTEEKADPIADFTDLDAGAWYADDVRWALNAGVMKGLGGGLFGPDNAVSRAMAVTVLWRREGSPTVNYAMDFPDVAPDAWYTEAVRWAASIGLTNGYGDGTFRPDRSVTREELATLYYRCAQGKGLGFTGEWMFLLEFDDAADISDWADEAMHWMVKKGVLTGYDDNTLVPGGTASRAELAAILHRFDAILAGGTAAS